MAAFPAVSSCDISSVCTYGRRQRQERGKREHGFLVLLIGAVILSYEGLILTLILPERSQIQLRGFRASACGFGGTLAVNNTSSCVFQQSSPL